VFGGLLFVFLAFFFGKCSVCPSIIYGFWSLVFSNKNVDIKFSAYDACLE